MLPRCWGGKNALIATLALIPPVYPGALPTAGHPRAQPSPFCIQAYVQPERAVRYITLLVCTDSDVTCETRTSKFYNNLYAVITYTL